jgi:exopolysaccharide biosynthesis polyprenyl glycosylphosphotransferase
MSTTTVEHSKTSELVPVASLQTRRFPGSLGFQDVAAIVEVLVDALAVLLSVFAGQAMYLLSHLGRATHYSMNYLLGYGVVLACVFVLLLHSVGGYRRDTSLLRIKETERVIRTTIRCFVLSFAASFFTQVWIPRLLLVFVFLHVIVLVLLERHFLYAIEHRLHARGLGVKKVVIYGANQDGQRIFSALVRSTKLGLDPVAVVDDNPEFVGRSLFESWYSRRRVVSVKNGPITRRFLQQCQAQMVIISSPSLDRQVFLEIVQEAQAAGATVSFVPHQVSISSPAMTYLDVDGLLLATTEAREGLDIYEAAKRGLDLALSLVVLVAAAPLLLFLAALVKFTSPGPAFFRQTRIGKDGQPFQMYKFRSMYTDAPKYARSPLVSSDPRITRVGAFLRRTSLDELPQIINVIKGDMSLVGPRPEMPFIVEQYDEPQRQRLAVKPGITGLWQLSADRAVPIHENLQYDLYYIRHRSLLMDIAVLVHTIAFAMRGV